MGRQFTDRIDKWCAAVLMQILFQKEQTFLVVLNGN